MAQRPRIVAELGRPETPEETAERKAASSAAYRSSQTFRNLIAALLVTAGIVAIIVLMVPRADPAPREPIDVAAVAEQITDSEGRTAIAPELPAGWVVNRAGIEGDGPVRAWTIVYAPGNDDERGFVRVAQGFDADAAWVARVLSGAAPDEVVTIEGIRWDRYELDPSRTGNIAVALSTTAGSDTILIYGALDAEKLDVVARAVAAEVRVLTEETTK